MVRIIILMRIKGLYISTQGKYARMSTHSEWVWTTKNYRGSHLMKLRSMYRK